MKAIEDLLQAREASIRELEFSVKCLSDAEVRAAQAEDRITKAKAILQDASLLAEGRKRALAALEGK